MLHPDFFQRAKWGDAPMVFPDRFDLLREWVIAGGHFHMNGGWLSFSGELGKGGWGRSRFHDALPVECLPHDDLVESTAGYVVRGSSAEHSAVKGLDWSMCRHSSGSMNVGCELIAKALLKSRTREKAEVSTVGRTPTGHWSRNSLDDGSESSLGYQLHEVAFIPTILE